jgi:hypothetical protein
VGTNYRGGWRAGGPGRPPRHVVERSIHGLITARQGPKQIEWASDAQREFFEYGPAPVCASGGFGASKSFAACFKALYLSDLYPGNRGVIARSKWTELKDTTMKTFFKICPAEAYSHGGRRSDTAKILQLNNGSEILWLHLDDPEIETVIKGLEINWFFMDQAEEMEEEIFETLLTRLGRWDVTQVPQHLIDAEESAGRSWPFTDDAGRALPPTYAMLACNPADTMHWVYRRFHPKSEEHYEKKIPQLDPMTGEHTGRWLSYNDMGYRMVTFDSLKNKFLPRQNRAELLNKDESFVRRFVRGEWGITEGTIHVIEPASLLSADMTVDTSTGPLPLLEWIRQNCKLHRFMDHGDSAPTACLWAASDDKGNIFIYREYYQPDRLISHHRERITELSFLDSNNPGLGPEHYFFNHADPSIFHLTSQKNGGRFSVADEYRDQNLMPRSTALYWQPADNNEMGTRNRINDYLRADKTHVHPFTKLPGAPRLYFVQRSPSYPNGCYYSIRETRAQRRKRIGSDLGRPTFSDDRVEGIPDHAYDCLRYCVASRPPVQKLPDRQAPAGSFIAVAKEYDDFLARGGYKRMAREQRRASRRRNV